MPIFQLNPRGAMAGSMKCPRRPIMLCARSGAVVAPVQMDWRQLREDPERHSYANNDGAGLRRKTLARSKSRMSQRTQCRHAVLRQFEDEGRAHSISGSSS